MIYIRNTTDFKFKNTCVTIGKFDGLHMGHQLLLSQLEKYEDDGLTSVMITIDFAPDAIPQGKTIRKIYSENETLEYLEKRGPEVLISYPFTKETMSTDPEEFLRTVLIGQLDAKVIVIGDDFCFGKDRKGNADFLREHEADYGYVTVVCPKLKVASDIVSSTLIRKLLEEGDTEKAEMMLNKSFFAKC